jgi:hypothetical protein
MPSHPPPFFPVPVGLDDDLYLRLHRYSSGVQRGWTPTTYCRTGRFVARRSNRCSMSRSCQRQFLKVIEGFGISSFYVFTRTTARPDPEILAVPRILRARGPSF